MFLSFKVSYAEVASKTLIFTVYDFDRFSMHDQIGQVQVPLNTIDLGNCSGLWLNLESPDIDEKVSHILYVPVSMILLIFSSSEINNSELYIQGMVNN